MMTASSCRASRPLLFPIPAARPEPLAQMLRRGRTHPHRVLVFRNRNHDLARMQVQSRLAEARAISINIVANNRPAHFGTVNAQLMGAAGDRFEREPGEIHNVTFRCIEFCGVVLTRTVCSLAPCGGGLGRGVHTGTAVGVHSSPERFAFDLPTRGEVTSERPST